MKAHNRWHRCRMAAVLLLSAAAAACSDHPGLPDEQVAAANAPAFVLSGACVITSATSTWGGSGFAEANDFGRILTDADNPSCVAGAASALRAKLAAIRSADPDFFGDDWLDGNYVAFVMAAATRIGAQGQMTASLDSLLQWVDGTFQYVTEPENGCGLDQTDNCLDGHSAAAAGYAWLAMYRYRHDNAFGASVMRHLAEQSMHNAFAAVCIRLDTTGVGLGNGTRTGPLCNGDQLDLAAGRARTYSWNLGQQFPHYGFGLMTSVAAAALGWEGGGGGGEYPFDVHQKAVARGLFEETRRVVAADAYLHACHRPTLLAGGQWAFTDSTANCAGPFEQHQPGMVALAKFYADRLDYTPPAGGYQSNNFGASWTLSQRDSYFGYGRYAFYGELGYSWWVTRREYMPMDANQPKGRLERVDGAGVAYGWACDPDVPLKPVKVEVSVNGTRTTGVANQASDNTIYNECGGGSAHRFAIQLPSGMAGKLVTARALDYTFGYTDVACSPGSCVVPAPPTVSVAWVHPSSVTWGPANTLTVAGHAQNGSGTVQVQWRDVSAGTGWTTVSGVSSVDASNQWFNTIPASNYCRTYQVRAVYSGVTSAAYTFNGSTAGYCAVRIIWVQPSARAGWPDGSLAVAGEATGGGGSLVTLWHRDITANGPWIRESYEAATDPNGIWINEIHNADPSHQYEVWVDYDVASDSCNYGGTNDIVWC